MQRALFSSAMVLMSRMRLTAGTAPASAPTCVAAKACVALSLQPGSVSA